MLTLSSVPSLCVGLIRGAPAEESHAAFTLISTSSELFRVFQRAHPETVLAPVNMTPQVHSMETRVRNGA